jgi:hypothetical protein
VPRCAKSLKNRGWRTARKAHYLGPERESSRFLRDDAEIVEWLPVAKMAGRWRINPTLIGHAIFPSHCKKVGGALEFVRSFALPQVAILFENKRL